MARVGLVPRGVAFLPWVRDWLEKNFNDKHVLVFVPHGRAAVRLRGLVQGQNVRVVPLRGDAELAKLAGVEMPGGVSAWRVYEVILNVLAKEMPELESGRRLGMASELAETVVRLQVQGVRRGQLLQSLPEGIAAHWELQAAALTACLEAVEKMGRSGAAVEREVFRLVGARAADLREKFVCVVAGVWDATGAATEMLRRVMGEDGWMVLPEGGTAMAALREGDQKRDGWLKKMGMSDVVRLGEEVVPLVREVVCAGPWEEIEALAGWVEKTTGPVTVVVADGSAARRVRGGLAARGILVRGGFGSSLCESGAGALWRRVAEAMAAPGAVRWAALRMGVSGERWGALREAWKGLGRWAPMSAWVTAMEMVLDAGWDWRGMDGAEDVAEVVRGVEMEGSFERGMAAGILLRALRETARKEEEGARVTVMGARDARLLDFENVMVVGAVDSVWPGSWRESWVAAGQARAVGLGDAAHRALLVGAEMENVLMGGSRNVWVFRHAHDGGVAVLPSRFLRGVEMMREDAGAAAKIEREAQGLGSWIPAGAQYPTVWSASFVETMMACPYKAYAQRILRLVEVEPIEAAPDPRVGGIVVHRWLEKMALVGTDFGRMDDAVAVALQARMVGLVEDVLAEEDAVTKAIWRPKLKKLAPVLVAKWRADGRRVESVEKDVRKLVGKVTVRAIVDRVEKDGEAAFVIDYKTGTLPSWKEVEAGEKPQLALEGWLLDGAAGLEYWKLRGYGGTPVEVRSKDAEKYVAPVEEGVKNLVGTFAEGSRFPALPDMEGGGLLPTGHCAHCILAGVCRRQEMVR